TRLPLTRHKGCAGRKDLPMTGQVQQRRRGRAYAVVVAAAGLAGRPSTTWGEGPPAAPRTPPPAFTFDAPPPAPAPGPPLTHAVQVPPVECSLLHQEIAGQLQFGFPAGVRVQFPFAGRANRYTVAEVFGGVEWTVLVASAGVRTIFEIPLNNAHDAFVVGPG